MTATDAAACCDCFSVEFVCEGESLSVDREMSSRCLPEVLVFAVSFVGVGVRG